MESVKNPFNETSTFLLSPLMVSNMIIFLYKPEALTPETEAEFFQHESAYELSFKENSGTIAIHTRDESFYQEALIYLFKLYSSKPDDEDHQGVLWKPKL